MDIMAFQGRDGIVRVSGKYETCVGWDGLPLLCLGIDFTSNYGWEGADVDSYIFGGGISCMGGCVMAC